MSALQEQVVQMISNLSDDNVRFLLEIIQRLMPQKSDFQTVNFFNEEESMRALHRLEAARAEIRQYLPDDFDPDRELREAKAVQMKEFKDLEDCLQDKCANSVGAEYIITRNTADFVYSEVPAILPEDFLKVLG